MNNYVMALFASGTTNFDYMGLGPLSDAISAVATETATSNGNITYTMEMDYPINGQLASQLVEGNLIKAQVSKTPGDYMIFEINETLKSDNRTITVYCDAYANRILRMSFDNGGKFGSFSNVQEALNAARSQMAGIQSDFTLTSGLGTDLDMSGVSSKNSTPTIYQNFNAYLDAIMDKVQGNVRFGVNSIQIVSDRGRDIEDTVLRDDKNTNGISIKVDTSNIINRIIPILPVLDSEGNTTQETVVGNIVTSSVAFKFINFYAGQVINVDTQDLANSYFNRTNCDRPTTTATVQTSMLDEDLTDIRLFDRIQVYSSKIGYQAKLKVCERDFDILAGAVSEFKLGSSSVTIFNSQTSVINTLNSAVQSAQYAAITADGKNTAYYEGYRPSKAKENDLWFHSVNGISQIDQYVNGNWVTIVSDSTGEQIREKVGQVGVEAKAAVDKAKSASDKADQLSSKYDDTNLLANQALDKAVSAVSTANSTASEFGKVDQKADGAVSAALNAQNDASSAANQASSAAADSKDAKQIAGAVSQSYKTLTDGSTMTIAELESGLAAKLTKNDLNGYATETWTQNQIKVTADSINGTLSSIKSTVDGQTTSINDLKADSSSFKDQFTTVNNTLGKQTTDIGALQASSQELTSGFNTLTSDNTTNKNDISQLKQTSTEVSSTLETVQTQVQNSAVGTNILLGTRDFDHWHGTKVAVTNGSETFKAATGTNPSANDYDLIAFNNLPLEKDTDYTASFRVKTSENTDILSYFFDSGSNGSYSDGGTVNHATTDYTRVVVHFHNGNNTATPNFIPVRIKKAGVTVWVYGCKLEKGSLATDWCPNPADNATVTALSSLSQTVDGMKSEISKKIESTDLNGYATQTWTQNQIKTTADGISGSISSIKSTVDSQTTSINDLKADSEKFEGQFTTVNNTLGSHSTDIGSLQASAKEFNNTLMTVQTQVQNSAVGTNLLTNTGDLSATWNLGPGVVLDTSQKPAVLHYPMNTLTSSSMNITEKPLGDKLLQPSTTYTASFYAKGTGTFLFYCYPSVSQGASDTRTPIKLTSEYKLYTITFTTLPGLSGNKIFLLRQDSSAKETETDQNTVEAYVYGLKLEKGSLATDWCPNPADNAPITALSSLSQTVDKIQTTVRGKVDNDVYQSKVTELNNQITSVVGQVNSLGQKNLVTNSQFQYDWKKQWDVHCSNPDNWYHSDYTWAYVDGYQGICAYIEQSQSESYPNIASTDVKVPDPGNTVYSASVYVNIAWVETYCILDMSFYNAAGVRTAHDATASNKGLNFLKLENIVSPKDAVRVHIELFVHDHGSVAFIEPMLVQGSSVGKYIPDTATWSEVQQTADAINLKVSKDGVVNAVNISTEGIQIYGNKLHITADTYIDNAIIKDSMIESLNAAKITAGTIDADKIQVIHLNANNITTGKITGSNLGIDLNTGQVSFNRGRISSTNSSLDINIDEGYIALTNNYDHSILLKNGQLQFTQPNIFDPSQGEPYLNISNEVVGDALHGASIIGRDYVGISIKENWVTDIFGLYMITGPMGFAGLGVGKNYKTIIGGADRGVFISGGPQLDYKNGLNPSPSISIGSDATGAGTGNRVNINAEYLHAFSVEYQTTSAGPNVFVAPDGALVRSTSALKYKEQVERTHDDSIANKLLTVPTATWIDKAEKERYNNDPDNQLEPKRHFGMIAEDLAAAGIEELVVRGLDGELEGIEYARIGAALVPLIKKLYDRVEKLEELQNENNN